MKVVKRALASNLKTWGPGAMNTNLFNWVTEVSSQSLCFLSIVSKMRIKPLLIRTLATHVTVCKACSNKLATSILKTIQGQEYSIYNCYLYRPKRIQPGLVEWPIIVAEFNVSELKYYTKLPYHLEGK